MSEIKKHGHNFDALLTVACITPYYNYALLQVTFVGENLCWSKTLKLGPVFSNRSSVPVFHEEQPIKTV